VRPARCDRSRESISLRLDGALSTFEAALLDRHLRRCADCRSFAADVDAQTAMLRAAALELPEHGVVVPAQRARKVRRSAVGAFGAVAAAAAAALAIVSAAGNDGSQGLAATGGERVGKPVLVVVAARPSLSVEETVPRLTMQPASVADGPLHTLFSIPV
jgi:predicted anti-sigma-YlaC factor YlaD